MNERRIDGFFYGLFMDVGVLRNSGVVPVNPRKAYVDGFALRVGSRATLVPSPRARAYGMLIALTHPELERLYGAPGLDQYRAEAVLACCIEGGAVPALCYNLPVEPRADERNPDYAARLQKVLRDLNFPAEYVNSIVSG
ncbi:MAG: gamma-glutamylcyclotransferase family protein [Steroidobacteraceae bacterium]